MNLSQTLHYQHQDPRLQAELKFDQDSSTWILYYHRNCVLVGTSLYQSRATAELLLNSLGYQRVDLSVTSA